MAQSTKGGGSWGNKMMVVRLINFLAVILMSSIVLADVCPSGGLPKAAVGNYLKSMQEHRFVDAYSFVSESMTDGKSKQDWSDLQQMFYEGGGVIIFGVDIRQPSSVVSDKECTESAIVPNVLKSRDNFNNQGITEFELYTVILKEGLWLVDSQETLFEQPDVDIWFPGEVIPEFLDKK